MPACAFHKTLDCGNFKSSGCNKSPVYVPLTWFNSLSAVIEQTDPLPIGSGSISLYAAGKEGKRSTNPSRPAVTCSMEEKWPWMMRANFFMCGAGAQKKPGRSGRLSASLRHFSYCFQPRAATARRTWSSTSTRLTPSRMWPMPATPEMAALAPAERGAPSTCSTPRTRNITAVRLRPA